MMKRPLSIFFTLCFGVGLISAQEINQFDSDGERHGTWQKKFPGTDQLRYTGQFEHGKEVGVFKFYCQECKGQPTSIRTYGKKGVAKVQYFTASGKLVSEGDMIGKKRKGEWVYYHKKGNNIMTREFYVDGLLHGKKSTYYPNGQVTEELNFVNGSKEGENLYYSPDGVLLKKLKYGNDKLQGPAEYYDANGNVTIKGNYRSGKKHGLWQYFKNGKLELEETYPKPLKRTN
ncbi:toxin-antitoxin system YwqK family antitoxin [Aureisphaera sp.]